MQRNCSDGSDVGMGEKGSRKHDGDGWRKGHSGLARVPWSMVSWGCGGAGASLGWESREQLRPLLVAMVEPKGTGSWDTADPGYRQSGALGQGTRSPRESGSQIHSPDTK